MINFLWKLKKRQLALGESIRRLLLSMIIQLTSSEGKQNFIFLFSTLSTVALTEMLLEIFPFIWLSYLNIFHNKILFSFLCGTKVSSFPINQLTQRSRDQTPSTQKTQHIQHEIPGAAYIINHSAQQQPENASSVQMIRVIMEIIN